MIKRFLRKLLTEPSGFGKRAEPAQQQPQNRPVNNKPPSNPIDDLKRRIGATERHEEPVTMLRIGEGMRAAFDRPDIPLTPERLSLINEAMRRRAKVLNRIPESSRRRLIDALARHLGQGKK